MDEGGPSVIDPQISEFRAFDARFGALVKECHKTFGAMGFLEQFTFSLKDVRRTMPKLCVSACRDGCYFFWPPVRFSQGSSL